MNSKTLRTRMGAMLFEGICALDVAEALLSVDAVALEQDAELPEAQILGVRQAGRVSAFVTLLAAFHGAGVSSAHTPLTNLVHSVSPKVASGRLRSNQ